MTLVDQRPTERQHQVQVLFEEARRRRRRRWLISGVAMVLVLGSAALVVTGGAGHADRTRPGAERPRLRPRLSTPAPGTVAVTDALGEPEALAVASNGGVLIDDQASNRIVEGEPNGAFEVIAGDGRTGSAGDGGPATLAELDLPVALAVGSDGTVYVADLAANRIRAVHPDGRISTLARVSEPSALAVGPTGTVDVVDSVGIQAVGPEGTIATLVAPSVTGPGGTAGDISVAGVPFAFDPDAIAVSAGGDLYVANVSPKTIVRFSPTGTSPTLVGSTSPSFGQTYVTRAGLAAAARRDHRGGRRRGVRHRSRAAGAQLGVIRAFARGSVPGVQGVFRPSGVAVAADGEVYVDTDGRNGGTTGPCFWPSILTAGPTCWTPVRRLGIRGRSGIPPAAERGPFHPSPIRMSTSDALTPNTSSSATSAPSHR